MKLKYHRFMRRVLPSIIVVPAIAQMASADVFNPDSAGNIQIPSNFSALNGQDFTILASGGSGTSYTLDIASNVTFTGDTVLEDGIQVSVSGYTITNNGVVIAIDEGIEASTSFSLNNFGTIEGLGGEGIEAIGGTTTIFNASGGLIRGVDDGIYFSGDGGQITNNGTITGAAGSDAIQGENSFRVDNYGTLTGAQGVVGLDSVQAYNYGTITASNGHGVTLGNSATYENISTFISGSLSTSAGISGTSAGVIVGNDSYIFNDADGQITGTTNGAFGGTNSDIENIGGDITATTGTGATVGSGGTITNENFTTVTGDFYGASIIGAINGTILGDDAYIYNEGTITGLSGTGVIIGDGIVPGSNNVFNEGTITGEVNGIFAANNTVIYNDGDVIGTTGSGVLAGFGLDLTVDDYVSGATGVTTTSNLATIKVYGVIEGTGGTALSLGSFGGVGNNSVQLFSNGSISGDIIASGTGNSITSSSGTIEGDISGVQQITVNSFGYLDLQGDILTPATLTVGTAGLLTGSGTWQADITLATDSYIYGGTTSSYFEGVLNISGNVSHAVDSIIYKGIQSDAVTTTDGSTSAVIRSTAGVYDATGAIIELGNSNSLALRNGTQLIVEDAGGTVVTGGNEVSYYGSTETVLAQYFSTSGINGAGNLVVDINHNFAALPGLSDNQSSAGAGLDSFMVYYSALPAEDPAWDGLREFIDDLDSGSLAQTQASLGAMVAPAEAALALTQSVVNSNYRTNRLVQDHLAAVRSSADVVSMQVGSSSSKDAPAAPTGYSKKGNVWGSVSYDWQDYEGDGDFSDFDGETASFTAGVDYRVAPDFVIGGLLDGSRADLDGNGGSTDIDSFRASIYGTYGKATGIYADFLLGYGSHDNDYTDADSFQALVTVGYTMGTAQLKHGPYAGLEYQNVDVDGFDEDGGLPFASEVDGFEIDSLRALIGYRVNGDYGRFKPYASISYAHEFEDGSSHTRVSFAGTSFRVAGGEQGSAILLTAGTGIALTADLRLDVGYRGEVSVDSDGMDSHGGSLGLNWSF